MRGHYSSHSIFLLVVTAVLTCLPPTLAAQSTDNARTPEGRTAGGGEFLITHEIVYRRHDGQRFRSRGVPAFLVSMKRTGDDEYRCIIKDVVPSRVERESDRKKQAEDQLRGTTFKVTSNDNIWRAPDTLALKPARSGLASGY